MDFISQYHIQDGSSGYFQDTESVKYRLSLFVKPSLEIFDDSKQGFPWQCFLEPGLMGCNEDPCFLAYDPSDLVSLYK